MAPISYTTFFDIESIRQRHLQLCEKRYAHLLEFTTCRLGIMH